MRSQCQSRVKAINANANEIGIYIYILMINNNALFRFFY